jgi:hypothetical protein
LDGVNTKREVKMITKNNLGGHDDLVENHMRRLSLIDKELNDYIEFIIKKQMGFLEKCLNYSVSYKHSVISNGQLFDIDMLFWCIKDVVFKREEKYGLEHLKRNEYVYFIFKSLEDDLNLYRYQFVKRYFNAFLYYYLTNRSMRFADILKREGLLHLII